jgi:hypothetical protein
MQPTKCLVLQARRSTLDAIEKQETREGQINLTATMGGHWGRLPTIGVVLALIFNTAVSVRSKGEDEAVLTFARRLDEYNFGDDDNFQYDLSGFSLRFDKCQYIKMYDDDLADDENSDSPLAINHFVVFRLCPSDECDSCNTVYGQYVADVESYLKYSVDEQEKAFETMCSSCSERCNGTEDSCSGCGKICYRYENLEASGYIDASNYIECQALEVQNNNDGENNGDDQIQLYIGPRCSKDGNRILIGLFSDQYCVDPYTDAEPEDYIGGKLSYHLLSHTYNDDGSVCLSCKEDSDDENEADAEDADDVNEMCEEIYSISAKCESNHGLTSGFIQVNQEENEYTYENNQSENEFLTCNFIQSLLWNSYTETGEINFEAEQNVIIRYTTGLQKAAVSFLALSVVGLVTAVYFLQKQIDRTFPKVDLSCQSDNAQIT